MVSDGCCASAQVSSTYATHMHGEWMEGREGEGGDGWLICRAQRPWMVLRVRSIPSQYHRGLVRVWARGKIRSHLLDIIEGIATAVDCQRWTYP